jgi:hypothetical protein
MSMREQRLEAFGFTMRWALWIVGWNFSAATFAEDGFELPPIRYSVTPSHDPVAQLKQRLDTGEVVLERDDRFGYLPSLLRALDVPQESQVLVFSKTSLQIHKISPTNPRGIFFNDSVYVGYVPGSETIELAANDPMLGAVFYTLDGSGGAQEVDEDESERAAEGLSHGIAPALVRDRGNCLSCHATSRTENVPGYLVRSIFPDRAGRPRTGSSSYTTDFRSPWSQRWGGWYVTGSHGSMRHMGNAFAVDRMDPQKMDFESGANLMQLPSRVRPELHLQPSSDLVSLMVLEHQAKVHNLITRANYETRQSLAMDQAMNRALGRPEDYRSESTERRIAASANALVDALLMSNEPGLESSVQGNGKFREAFESRGPKGMDGRSLRQLDLETRLFRYPLSFLIYTPEFQALPTEVMEPIKSRLAKELSDPAPGAVHGLVPCESRLAIREILAETLPHWLDNLGGHDATRSGSKGP